MTSYAGRIEFANDAQSRGLLRPENAQEFSAFLRLIATGDGDTSSSPAVTEAILIQQENELILKGIIPPVLYSDNDELHIQHHDSVMNNPFSRLDNKALNALDAHRAQHEKQLASKLPPPPPGESPPPLGGDAPPPEAAGTEGVNELGQRLPELPMNPITGQQMDAPNGALGGVPA